MHQETADEFHMPQRDSALRITRPAPPCRKNDLCVCYGEDPAVRDCDLMCITAEIFNGIAEAVKSFFYVRAPVFFVKAVPEFFPLIGIAQLFTGSGKQELLVLVKLVQARKIFSFEQIPQDMDRKEERFFRMPYLMVWCQSAARKDTVHMDMIGKLLVPGVEDLYDPWGRAEIFFVFAKFQKCL